MPERVRVQGDLFHGVIPEGAVYVGRAAPGLTASPYANPFKISGSPVPTEYGGYVVLDATDAVALFKLYVGRHPELAGLARADLAGRDLACWCKPGEPCHADVLLAIANGGPDGS